MLHMLSKKQAMRVSSLAPTSSVPLHSSLTLFSDAGWIFAQHFCNRLGPAYLALKNVLDDANPLHGEVLNNIKKRFREETFTRQGISETILAYPDLVRLSSESINLAQEVAAGG